MSVMSLVTAGRWGRAALGAGLALAALACDDVPPGPPPPHQPGFRELTRGREIRFDLTLVVTEARPDSLFTIGTEYPAELRLQANRLADGTWDAEHGRVTYVGVPLWRSADEPPAQFETTYEATQDRWHRAGISFVLLDPDRPEVRMEYWLAWENMGGGESPVHMEWRHTWQLLRQPPPPDCAEACDDYWPWPAKGGAFTRRVTASAGTVTAP